MDIRLQLATDSDKPAISELIAQSARGLGEPFYTPLQIEIALQSAFGVDSQLISDKTFFLAYANKELAGCGGWSFRDTLFGSDREKNRSSSVIDPATGAARIRAFFIHPAYARMGVGSLILQACELSAWNRGYRKLQLMATLPGVAFYTRNGFFPGQAIQHPLDQNVTIEFLPMRKELPSKPNADESVLAVL